VCYAVEMELGAMIYIPSFIKVGSGIQKFYKGDIQTSRHTDSRSHWPRDLRHELFSLPRMLGSWVRIPFKAWISVCVHSVFVLPCV
jgi:hypothetical protein